MSYAPLPKAKVIAACRAYLEENKRWREKAREEAIEKLRKPFWPWSKPRSREEAEAAFLADDRRRFVIQIAGQRWEGEVRKLLRLAHATDADMINVSTEQYAQIDSFYDAHS